MHSSIDYDNPNTNNHDGKQLAIIMSVAINLTLMIDKTTMVILVS